MEEKKAPEFKRANKITKRKIENHAEELYYLFQDVPTNKKILINTMIERTAFMLAELDELEAILKRDGPIEIFVNGRQRMQRISPAAMQHNSAVKNIKSYLEALIKEVPASKGNALNNFMNKNKSKLVIVK